MKGILVDLHDTLLKSREAWIQAYVELRPDCTEEIISKYSQGYPRRKLAAELDIDFTTTENRYCELVSPNVFLIDTLSKYSCPLIIVSNAPLSRVARDLQKVPLNYSKVYTKENGQKPDPKYIEHILDENQLKKAIFLGNNPTEDIIPSERIVSVLIDSPDLVNSINTFLQY